MLMFTVAISCLATSSLSCFMDLTFQVPMQYCSLQRWTLLLSPSTSANGYCFCFGSTPSCFLKFFFPLISNSILGTSRAGKFIFQCPILLPFHSVQGVLKARILKWFASSTSSGPHSFTPLHHYPSVLVVPTWHGLVSLS